MSATHDAFQVELVVDQVSELEGARQDLEEAGATKVHVPDDGGQDILPILVVIGVIAGITALADLVMRIRAKTSCQEIIDARDGKVKISKNCDFKDGKIIVISGDDQKVEVHDVPDGFDVTKVVEAALKGGADAVKAAAEAAGAKATDPKPAAG
jgi:hypothetical protein